MTSLEKKIYNTHLAISRTLRNKPFKKRENFDKFEDDTKYHLIKRIATLFQKYPDIDIYTYFVAPYKLYKDVEYFDLSYFSSPRAIKSYTIYKQELLENTPDNHKQHVLETLQFITKFCIENRVQLDDYVNFKSTSIEPDWLYHFKKNNLNWYTLMEFPGVYDIISSMPSDEKELLLGDFGINFLDYKRRYNNSKILKPTLSEAYNRVKFFIDKKLAQA